jgi:hypothetical protein
VKKLILLASCLALAAAVAVGCARREAPSASAEAVAGSGRLLPPGAYGYFAFDVRAVLAAPAVAPHADTLLGLVPPPCADLLQEVDRVVIAGYGPGRDALVLFPQKRQPTDPPHDGNFVAVFEGTGLAQVAACFDELSRQDDTTPPPAAIETVAGREVRSTGSALDLRLFSAGAATQVLATPKTLDAALAAAAGGPSLAGSPALEALAHVPLGTATAGIAMTPDMAKAIFGSLEDFGDGTAVPMPRALAVSVRVGSEISVTMVLQLADEAAARTVEKAAATSLAAFQRLASDGARGGLGSWEAPFVRHATVGRDGATVVFGAHFPLAAVLAGLVAGGESESRPR